MGNILDTFNYFDELEENTIVTHSNRNEYYLNENQIRGLYSPKANLVKAFRYAKAMERGDIFPPVSIFYDQKIRKWKVNDGAHRTMAAKMAGVKLFVRSKFIMGESK